MTMTMPGQSSPGELATEELRVKSLKSIQCETSIKWADRAIVATARGLDERTVDEYRHEALEHAGLSGDRILLSDIRAKFRAPIVQALANVPRSTGEELQGKSLADIQRETAFQWAWRCYAACHLAISTVNYQARGTLVRDAVVYQIEAIEHAVLCGDDAVLQTVRQIVDDARRWAFAQTLAQDGQQLADLLWR